MNDCKYGTVEWYEYEKELAAMEEDIIRDGIALRLGKIAEAKNVSVYEMDMLLSILKNADLRRRLACDEYKAAVEKNNDTRS